MHIDMLNLLWTAHTFSATYINIHTVKTYILFMDVCVSVNSLVFKTLRPVEGHLLSVNPRLTPVSSTWNIREDAAIS